MAIIDNPGSAFRHFGGKSVEDIIQRATTIIEQTEELSFEEAIVFFVEIFFQSQSLQKRVQVQVAGVYCGEKKQ